jgi:recombination protein RecA
MADKAVIEKLKNTVNAFMKEKVLVTMDEGSDLTIPRNSSGILALDNILGKGSNGYGFPVGRLIEIYGPESGGKTSVILAAIASVQGKGGVAAIIDAEHALNFEYAAKLGVKVDELLICQPDSAEEAFNVTEALVKSGDVDLVVLDSIAALTPIAIMDSSFEDKHMDSGAKLNNRFAKTISVHAKNNDCTVILINQLREKVGVMYGNPEYAPGGRGIKFAASIRLEVRRGEVLKKDGDDYGHVIKCKTVKNKTFAPNKTCEFRIIWGEGFDNAHSLITVGVANGILRKSGAWIYYGDDLKFQGEEKMLAALNSDKELFEKLQKAVSNG